MRASLLAIIAIAVIAGLAAIAGNKFVIVDACQSGEAAASPVRVLVPGGQGPIVMAACDRNQKSYEDPKLKHGLFTYAILEALGERFKQADIIVERSFKTEAVHQGYIEPHACLVSVSALA